MPDILIVDNKHDLNVYFNTEDNEPTSKCCTSDESRPKDDSSTSSQTPPSQQQTGALPQEARRLASGMVIEDLNEWAGKEASRRLFLYASFWQPFFSFPSFPGLPLLLFLFPKKELTLSPQAPSKYMPSNRQRLRSDRRRRRRVASLDSLGNLE
jgi:hypothetical protein